MTTDNKQTAPECFQAQLPNARSACTHATHGTARCTAGQGLPAISVLTNETMGRGRSEARESMDKGAGNKRYLREVVYCMASLSARSTRFSSCEWRSTMCSWPGIPYPNSSITVSMLICSRRSWGAPLRRPTRRHSAAVEAARSRACPEATAEPATLSETLHSSRKMRHSNCAAEQLGGLQKISIHGCMIL